ncbi:DUF1919 domain-containing protein [Fusibacillus kribbianus]|uniref:DUF1919 domain-containing protein n=1 Tax=Fusibacillus kribbianus TaxID=3044208 RepID=UPI003A7F104B
MGRFLDKIQAVLSMLVNNFYESLMRHRLKNHNFSIVCSNCAGGVISHRLGKKISFTYGEPVASSTRFPEAVCKSAKVSFISVGIY